MNTNPIPPHDSDPDNYSRWLEAGTAQTWFTPSESFYSQSQATTTQELDFYDFDQPLSLILSSARAGINRPDDAGGLPSLSCCNHEAGASSSRPSLPGPSLSSFPPVSQSTTAQLSPEEISNLLEMGTGHAFLLLHHNRLLSVQPVNGFHAFKCPKCSLFISTSISESIILTSVGQFTPLVNHYRRKACMAAQVRLERDEAQEILSSMNVTHSLSPSPSLRPSNSITRDTSPSFTVDPDLHTRQSVLDSELESQVSAASISTSSSPVFDIRGPPEPCYGLPFQWRISDDSNMQMNIPWSRTRKGSSDELPFTINIIDEQCYARSADCTRFLPPHIFPTCPSCIMLEPKVLELGLALSSYQPRTRRSLQNLVQLSKTIDNRNKELNDWKLRSLNDDRKLGRKLATVKTHNALLMAIAENDVPWLRNLLQTQINNGASINGILHRLEDALEHGFRTRGYSDAAYDIAILAQRLGGSNLLYALNHRMCIPSLRAIKKKLSFAVITPTIGPITVDTISANIRSIIIDPRVEAGQTTLRGISLLTDEVALEEAAVYFPKQNGIGGLCWKHAHHIDPILNTYESATHVASKLSAGQVHLGKEMSVIVAHCFGEDETYPILTAPSCKEEDHNDWERLIEKIVDTWYSTDAHCRVGPLWSFATDGDSTRRKAGHKVFLKQKLDESSSLFGILSDIPGLNLYTGKHEMTLDFDYKHVFKRFCTMLRSSHGLVLCNGRRINAKMLQRYLLWIDGYDKVKVDKLIYPDDPQDVPRAIELIRAVIQLAAIDPTKPPYTPQNCFPDVDAFIDFEALAVLGRLLHHLLEPFVNVNLSLSQQVTHLAAFSHLCFSLYRAHRRAFMPNQLYYDSQTLVKNAIFCIAKQQRLNATSPFYLPDVGDDPIELLFAFLRMCGGHNSALNYKQGIDRLRAARDIAGVYSRQPDLHHGHHRLNFSRSEHVDHINRNMWKGDILASSINLRTAWLDGRKAALDILSSSTLDPAEYDYETLFLTVDTLSVFGGGFYPGINEDADDNDDPSVLPKSTPTTMATIIQGAGDSEIADAAEDEEVDIVLSFEDSLENELNAVDDLEDAVSSFPASPIDASPPPPSGPGVRTSDYLLVDQKWVHKASVCRILFNSNFTPKSHDRLLRVRGFTPVNKHIQSSDSVSSEESSAFVVGSPFVTLLRLRDHTTSLALIRSSSIHENGVSRAEVGAKSLASTASKIKVAGDVLTLQTRTTTDSEDKVSWIWNGRYLKTSSPLPNSNISTQKLVEVTVSSCLIEPINPSVVIASTYLTPEDCTDINSSGLTWGMENEILGAAIEAIWKRVCDLKIPLSTIPLLSNEHKDFPYQNENGTNSLVCDPATTQLLASHGSSKEVICQCCHKPTKDLRSHMGGHILRSRRGISEVLAVPVGDHMPCGFCGRSGYSDCAVRLKETASKREMETSCPYQVPFKFGFADSGSESRPCRNVPVVCPLCVHRGRETDFKVAIWRYNMEEHLNFVHSHYAHPGKLLGDLLPSYALYAVLLTVLEEKKLGVPVRPAFSLFTEKENDVTGGAGQKRRRLTAKASTSGAAAGAGIKRARTKV